MKNLTPYLAILMVVGLAVLSRSGMAQSTSRLYHSPDGYSILVPASWNVLDSETSATLAATVSEKLNFSMSSTRPSLVLFDPKSADYSNNINVIVEPNSPDSNPSGSDVASYRQALQSSMSNGVSLTVLSAKAAPYCGHTAIEAELELSTGGKNIRELQVAVAEGSNMYIMTCAGPDATYNSLRPTFEQTVNSLAIDPGRSSPSKPMSIWLKDAIIGGLVGLGLAFFSGLSKPKQGPLSGKG